MTNPYRSHPEQYKYCDRNFSNGDRVVFVGPPDEEYQPGMIVGPDKHVLYGKTGQIRVGISEDIRVYPDKGSPDMVWVKFEGDKVPLRQISRSWLVRDDDYQVSCIGGDTPVL